MNVDHPESAVPRRPAWALTTALLASACNLVGYDVQSDPATADDGSAVRGSDDATPASFALADAGPGHTIAVGPDLDAGVHSLLDAMLHTRLDASRDGALLEGGWWTGIQPDQICPDGQKCWPTCEPAADTCVFDCAAATECQNTCLPGTACEVACEQVGHCFMACKEDGQCWLDCQNAADCEGWCTTGSHCQIDCASASVCHAMCLSGSSCEVDCRNGADCSDFSCSYGAECLVQCGAAGCDFECQGNHGASCPGNIKVCNRACP